MHSVVSSPAAEVHRVAEEEEDAGDDADRVDLDKLAVGRRPAVAVGRQADHVQAELDPRQEAPPARKLHALTGPMDAAMAGWGGEGLCLWSVKREGKGCESFVATHCPPAWWWCVVQRKGVVKKKKKKRNGESYLILMPPSMAPSRKAKIAAALAMPAPSGGVSSMPPATYSRTTASATARIASRNCKWVCVKEGGRRSAGR